MRPLHSIAILCLLLPSMAVATFDPSAMREKYVIGSWYHGIGSIGSEARNVDGLPGDEILIANGAMWTVLRWDTASASFMPAGVYENGVRELWGGGGMLSAGFISVSPSSPAEVAVLFENGTIRLFGIDGSAHNSWTPPGAKTPWMTVANVDGQGGDEILLWTSTGITAWQFGAATPLWRLPFNDRDYPLIAQLDDDPQMEAVFRSGNVTDTKTGEVQWRWPIGFGPRMASGDLNADGTPDLVACSDAWGRQCDAFDVAHHSIMWEIFLPYTSQIGPITIGDIDFDGRAEVFVGDSQWGPIRRIDGLTGQVTGETVQLGYFNFLMLANLTGGCEKSLVWAQDAGNTILDTLHVGDPQQMKIVWSSKAENRGSSGIVFGDFAGDGRRSLIWGSAAGSILRFIDFKARSEVIRVLGDDDWYAQYMPVTVAGQLDSDPALEYVVPMFDSPINKGIAVYDGATHRREWSLPVTLDDTVTSLDLSDVTGDGVADILVGSSILYQPRDHTEAIYAIDGATHKVLWRTKEEFSLALMNECPGCIVQVMAVDLDNDGSKEVLGIVPSTGLFCFEGRTGTFRWNRRELSAWAFTVADIDPSPGREIIVPVIQGGIVVLDSSGTTVLRQKDLKDTSFAPGAVRVADIDGDGSFEIIAGPVGGGLIVLSASTLDVLWSGGALRGYNFGSQMVVDDVDGDGTTEIVASSVHSLRVFEYNVAKPDATPPLFAQATARATVSATCCSVVLEWQPASDVGSMPVTYRIYRSAVAGFKPGPESFRGQTELRTFTDRALVPSQTYYYAVTAVDAAGNESINAPLSASASAPASCSAVKRRAVRRH